MLKSLVLVFGLFAVQNLFAGDCKVHVKRVPCSEATKKASFEKCDNKEECDDKGVTSATSEKDCAKKALKLCDNARLDITKSKTITAMYDGKPVEGGKQFCASDRPDFNKCTAK